MWQKIWTVFKDATGAWLYHRGNRMAAALAFYVMLSLSPLLIVAVRIAAIFVNRSTAIDEILQQIDIFAGPVIREALENFVENTFDPSQGVTTGLVSVGVLLYGASNVFNQLQDAFNTIWHVRGESRRENLWLSFKRRMFALLWVLGLGIVVSVLVTSSTVITAINSFLIGQAPTLFTLLLPVFDLVLSSILLSVVFTIMFKTMPQTLVFWRDVYWGGILTSLLFALGKYILSFYLGRSSVGSAYGAAGSLVVILVWVYYSSMIFFFGAEFTKAYASVFGSRRPLSG